MFWHIGVGLPHDEKARDPEMHQTQKGKQWFFGLKAHVGVDARIVLSHSLSTTAANVYDITETEKLLHSEEGFISVEADFCISHIFLISKI